MQPQTTYESRRQNSDLRLAHTATLIANHFKIPPSDIRLSNKYEDQKQATDLVIESLNLTIGVRVREPDQTGYYGEFTARLSGPIPEHDKIEKGMIQYYFYAFAVDEITIGQWWLMDVSKRMLRFLTNEKEGGEGEGYYHFLAYRINPASVVASSEQYPFGGYTGCK